MINQQITLLTLSEERLRSKQRQTAKVVGERDRPWRLPPQDPVDHKPNRELGMRGREVVVQLRLGGGGERGRGRRESRGDGGSTVRQVDRLRVAA